MTRLKGFRYPREIIAYAVWAYHRFPVSTADVEDLLAAWGVTVSRETVRLWVNRFGRHFADCIRRVRPRPNDKWHMDEAVISIRGKKHWLWRAIDANGDVLDIARANTPKRQGSKALSQKVGCRVRRAEGGYHRQVAQLHRTDQGTGARRRPPRPQRPEQCDRSFAQADPQTREDIGRVQIPPTGAEISVRA